MARSEYIRGTRSRTPYGYSREGLNTNPSDTNLLGWTLLILFLTALAIFSWLFPAYVFRNPEVPLNYKILTSIGKLSPIKAFDATNRPHRKDPKFFSAASLFESESGRPADQLKFMSSAQRRHYIQNYNSGDMLGYIKGNFEITKVKILTSDDFFPGVALLGKSIEFPNVTLEYLIPTTAPENHAYEPGNLLKISGGAGSLAAILNLSHLPQDRLSVSVVSLNYLDRDFTNGKSLLVAPPEKLNPSAKWPVFREN